eukprot:jgi/Picre1/27171/NNA_000140.t1
MCTYPVPILPVLKKTSRRRKKRELQVLLLAREHVIRHYFRNIVSIAIRSFGGVMARLSSMAYSEQDEFQRAASALVGASCVDFLYNSEGSEVGVAVNDDSIYIAFRGSEVDSQGFQDDWLETNFQTNIINAEAGDAEVNLHQGFYEHGRTVRNGLKISSRHILIALSHCSYTFGAPPVGGDLWLADMERSGMNTKVVNFVHPDDPVVYVQEAIESNLVGSILGSLTGITDDLRELRPAGRAADVTDAACVETFPAFNDDTWSFDAHAIDSYQSLIDSNCIVAGDSPYPEWCLVRTVVVQSLSIHAQVMIHRMILGRPEI